MKKLLTFILLIFSVSAFSQKALILDSKFEVISESSTLLTGLTAVYKLDETSGTIVYDSRGSNHGTNSGADFIPTGKVNAAYDFEASESDYVTLPNLAFTSTDSFSISGWAYLESVGNYFLVNKMETLSGWPNWIGWGLWLESSGDVTFSLRPDDVATYNSSVTKTVDVNLTAGAWHHIVVTNNGTATLAGIEIYVDATLPSIQGSQDTFSNSSSKDITVTSSASLGSSDGGGNKFYDGLLDEVWVWDRVLTPEEVTELNGLVDYEDL